MSNNTSNKNGGFIKIGRMLIGFDGDAVVTPAPSFAPTLKPTPLPTRAISEVGNIDLSLLQPHQGFVINGANAGDQLGYSVSNAGDINGDGFDDIIVNSAYRLNITSNIAYAGTTYIIFGKNYYINNINLVNFTNNNQGFIIIGNNFDYRSGYSYNNVASKAGDINGDGYDDIILGQPSVGTPWFSGTTYIIFGKKDGFDTLYLSNITSSQGFYIYDNQGYAYSGQSVSAAGDINGDGYDDIVINTFNPSADLEIAYVLFGKSDNFVNLYIKSIVPPYGFSILGSLFTYGINNAIRVSNAGDVNDDGYNDIIIGEYWTSYTNNNNYGVSHIIFGNKTLTNVACRSLTPTQGISISGTLNSKTGYSVASAGDINGDGYDDNIIMAPVTSGGTSYIIFGNKTLINIDLANLNLSQGFSITGGEGWKLTSIASIGDVNGDSYKDILVGYNNLNNNKGESFVFFGKANGFSNLYLPNGPQDFAIYGNPGDYSASSASGSGDINGDGYSDYIIGAPGANSGAGTVYVIYGNQYQTKAPTSAPSSIPTSSPSVPTSQPTAALDLGLVAYFPFNGNANDESSHNYVTTVNGATLTQDRFNNTNNAYHFTGGNIAIASDSKLQIGTGDYSITAWIKPDQSSGNMRIYSLGGGACYYLGYDFGLYNNVLFEEFICASGGCTSLSANGQSSLTTGIWYFVANTVQRGVSAKIYLNAIVDAEVSTVSSCDISININAYIGSSHDNLYPFYGSIDELRIYNRALTADEVQQLYTYNAPTPNPTPEPTYRPTLPIRQYANVDLANLNINQGISIYGAMHGDYAGYSVSGIGDFNGDGFDDVIVGAYKSSPALRAYAGTSYVIFGHPGGFKNIDLLNLAPSQGFKIFGVSNEDNSGYSVAGAGDVNGDGYKDIIIGSYKKQTVYIVYGKRNNSDIDLTNLNLNQGLKINSGYSFGWTVSKAGDVNNDGYDDVIIGESQISSSIGKAYVIFGKNVSANIDDLSDILLNQGFSIIGANTGDSAGASVSGAGDINGDGFDDIIIESPSALSENGISYVIFGKANCSNINLASLTLNQGVAIIGGPKGLYNKYLVSGSGDINGDGFDDIMIAAPYASPTYLGEKGIIYIIFGKTNGLTNTILTNLTMSQGFSITGNVLSGYSVSKAGDVNGDGYADIIIGAPYEASTNGNSYIIFGKASGFANLALSSLTLTQGFKITGLTSSYSGYSVSSAGDFNGDGYSDIIIGAYAADPLGRKDAGAAYIIFDSSAAALPSLVPTIKPTSPTIAPTIAPSVLTPVPTANPSFTPKPTLPLRQIADVNLGQLNENQAISIYGSIANEQIGTSVSGIGDFNGDGYDDVIIAGFKASPPARSYADKIYVIFGSNTGLSNIDLLKLKANQGFKLLGSSKELVSYDISGAGDVNGDGFADILVGAYLASPNDKENAGTVYVIFGHNNTHTDIDLTSFSSSQGFKIFGEAAGDQCGWSVASAGDFNNDGYDDIIIGAYLADPNNRNDAGKAYVVFGKSISFTNINLANLTPNQGIKIIGAAVGDYSGYAVNRAGDINGDEYFDIIIGAYLADPNNKNDAGISYVIFGQKDGYSIIDLAYLSEAQGIKVYGATTGDGSGYSVASADDINSDGYDDIIIGAPSADPNSRDNSGISYVIFGQKENHLTIDLANLSLTQGFKVLGAHHDYDHSGWSVSSAGDVNGDGYDDIVISARDEDNSVNNTIIDVGAAYVIFGKHSGFADVDLANLNNNNGFKISGVNQDDKVGSSVSGAGDFNGDGYDDLIIGAIGVDPFSRTNAGAAYIILYSGGTSTPTIAPTVVPTVTPTFVPTYIPTSMPTQAPTLLPTFTPTVTPTSAPTSVPTLPPAFIDLADLQGFQGFSIYGAAANDQNGISISSAGDINKDGYNDIIIGANGASPNGRSGAGIVYVIYGKVNDLTDINLTSFSSSQGFKIIGAVSGNSLGASVSYAGDINKDGYDDVIAAAINANNYGGIVYIIYGGNNLADIDLLSWNPPVQGFYITGIPAGNYGGEMLGSSLSYGGDINGDSYHDIVIGAYQGTYVIDPSPSNTIHRPASGKVYIVYGGNQTGLTNIASSQLTSQDRGFVINGANSNDLTSPASYAGDVNGDGYADIVIGAFRADPGGKTNAGKVYVIFGDNILTDIDLASLTSPRGFIINGINANDNLGGYVNYAGDVNNDGYADFIIGAIGANFNAGKTFIIYGGTHLVNLNYLDLLSFQGITIFGNNVGGSCGGGISTAKDINNDDFDDIMIGCSSANPSGRMSAGASYVIYGGNSLNDLYLYNLTASQGFSIIGANANDKLSTVSYVDDINGDGYFDIIVGAPNASPDSKTNAGASYVIYGAANGFITSASPTALPTSSPTTTLDFGLVAYYPFDGNANDVTGRGNDGVVHGATLVADRFGVPNSAYSFDGSTSYIEVVDGMQFDFTNNMSISIWVNPASSQVQHATLFDKSNWNQKAWAVEQALDQPEGANNFRFLYKQSDLQSWTGYTNTIQLIANQWNHYIIIKHDIVLKNYLNGNLISINYGVTANIDTNGIITLFIGATYFPNNNIMTRFFNGIIDDIRIYNRALTADEVQQLYTYNAPTSAPTRTALPTRALVEVLNTDLSMLQPYQGFVINGINAGDQLGYSVSSAGDVNGDGFDDIIIGAPFADKLVGDDPGVSYVIFGKSTGFTNINLSSLTATQGFSITASYSYLYSGGSASSGDINGDGYSDLIIGSSGFVGNAVNGRAFVIFGNATMTNVNFATLIMPQGFYISSPNNVNGFTSVASAGDINHDSYDDIVIAIPSINSNTGLVYVIFGKATGFTNLVAGSIPTSEGFSISGAETGSKLGSSLSSAGDINGDGFDDVIIGAPGAASNTGTSYIIFGRANNFTNIDLTTLNLSQGFYIKGESSFDYSGYSVSGAGDINGDGYDDIVIGAYHAPTVTYKGKAYIIYGKANNFSNIELSTNNLSSNNQGFIIIGANNNDALGYSVSGAGDINGDGYADIIIGTYKADPYGKNDAGISYVIFGKSSGFSDISASNLTPEQGFALNGVNVGYQSGFAVSGAGDINGDGYADYIVSTPYCNSDGKANVGVVYVLFGNQYQTHSPIIAPTSIPTPSPTMLPRAYADVDLAVLNINQGIMITGAVDGDQTGHAVANAGDFNGDGFDDVIIGAYTADPFDRNYAGTSYVLFGSANPFANIDLSALTTSQGFKIFGEAAGDESGYSVSAAGDFNHDGFDDVVIGARFADPVGRGGAGISYVIFGKVSNHSDIDLANLNLSQGFKIIGVGDYSFSGWSVGSAGDMNNDGYSDVIIGAPQANHNDRSKAGISYVIFGNSSVSANIDLANLNIAQGFKILGAAANDQSGISVRKAGDINKDGYDDIIIGAPGVSTSTESNVGAGYMVFGKADEFADIDLATMNSTQGFKIIGYQADGSSGGQSLSYAGDVNGDGIDDMIIGFMGADHG